MKKILSKALIALLILSTFGCSVKLKDKFGVNPQVVQETMAAYNYSGFSRANGAMKMMADAEENAIVDDSSLDTERKLIKTVDINSETKEFDKSIEWLRTYIETFHGIIDSSYIDSGNIANPNYRKSASFNVRIPATDLDTFVGNLGNKLNITFLQENVQDVTDTYNDTDTRKKTLLIEEEKLLEYLKKAKTVDEMIKIESKLSEVRSNLQNIDRRLKNLDKKIDYSTVNISIQEVKDLTEVVEKEDYSRENLIKQLNKNLNDTKRFIINCGVYLFTHIPAITLGLVVILIILIIVYMGLKNKKGKKKNGKI